MNIGTELINETWLWVAWACMLTLLAVAVVKAPWRAMLAVSSRQHVFYGAIIGLAFFWLFTINVHTHMDLHPLGVTAVTALFGWSFAIIAGAVAQVVYLLLSDADALAWPINSLLTVVVPATTTAAVIRLIHLIPFRNLFIYILGAGFFGGVLSVATVGLASVGLLNLIGQEVLAALAWENLPIVLMLMFPEGFINGTLVTTVTVFYPDLVRTFDERHYLG